MAPTTAAAAAAPPPSFTDVFPITAPTEGAVYPAGADIPLSVDASFYLATGLSILVDGARVDDAVPQVIQHQPASIPAPAPGRHTLQLRTLRFFDLAAIYTSHTPMPADCRIDGPIVAAICPVSSQFVHVIVLAPGQTEVAPIPQSTAVGLLAVKIADAMQRAPARLRTRCSPTANDALGTTYACVVRWTDAIYGWAGSATVRVTQPTFGYTVAVTFTGRRARRACVRARGLTRCQKPIRFSRDDARAR